MTDGVFDARFHRLESARRFAPYGRRPRPLASRRYALAAASVLGIPFGNRVRGYFERYRSSQRELNAVIETLYRAKDELLRDNTAIELEKAACGRCCRS